MPDTGTSVLDAPQTQEEIQAANKTELDTMMKINLNGGILPAQVDTHPTPDAPVVVTPVEPTFEIIKEKFGYDSPELAIKEIEELRAFREKPPTPTPIKYENEQSEKIAKALQAGKLKEVYQALHEQERLESLTTAEVTKENAANIIKLGMQLKYKNLTPSEIDYRYNQQFKIPKEPVQDAENETDPDFAIRKSEWQQQVADIEMNRVIEAKLAVPELEAAKSKIVFPEIEQNIDQDYIQWKKSLEERPTIDAQIQEEYKKLTPQSLVTKLPYKDETNKVDFEFQYEPDAESFNKSVEMVSDISKFFDSFKNADGTYDRKGFLTAINFATNKGKILTEAIKQAQNATIKSFLPDNSGNSGLQRQFPQSQSPNELDAGMQQAGIKRA